MFRGEASHDQRSTDTTSRVRSSLAATGRVAPAWLWPAVSATAIVAAAVTLGVTFEPARASRSSVPGRTTVSAHQESTRLQVPSVAESPVAQDAYTSRGVRADRLPPPAVAGFAGDNSQPPLPGAFSAQAIANTPAAVDAYTGRGIVRSWTIEKHCGGAQQCTFALTRSVPGFPDETGTLVSAGDGWHVTFAPLALVCTCHRGGTAAYMTRASFVLHFDDGGRSVVAHELNRYRSETCGGYDKRLDWRAVLISL